MEQVFGRFQKSDRRIRLMERLKHYIDEARRSRKASAVIIDGSFVTAKPEPSDIDLILVLKPEFSTAVELTPHEYNIQSRSRVRRRYGFDVMPAVEGSAAYDKYVSLFRRVRADDPEQANFRAPKGLLRIKL